jgi:hypothetical protein
LQEGATKSYGMTDKAVSGEFEELDLRLRSWQTCGWDEN